MLYAEVIGHIPVKTKFIQLFAQTRLPHAILLLGPEGTGGLPMAMALAQYIMCTSKTEFDSCGTCSNCQKAAKMQHPDILFSFPSINKDGTKALSQNYMAEFREFTSQTPYGNIYEWLQFLGAENKQGNITAEECRKIIEHFNLRAYEGEYKIMVMWRPEFLGNEGNMLLKLIEEPPPNTILLFVAENQEQILNTILSRVQLIKLSPLPATEIQKTLVSRNNLPEQQAVQLARLANGSYGEALRLMQHTENDLLPIYREWLNYLFTNKGSELSEWIVRVADMGRETQKQFLAYCLTLFEQGVRLEHMGMEQLYLLDEERVLLQKMMQLGFHTWHFGNMSVLVNDAIYHVERNANPKILFHALSIRLRQVMQTKA